MPSSEQPGAAREIPRPASTDLPAVLRFQSEQCAVNGSRLYGDLLAHVTADVEENGPCLHVLRGHERDPFGTALALRFMGGVHRLVLEGDAPDLAPYYPSVGGSLDAGDPWPAFRELVAANVDLLRERLADGVQTNEVGRAAALAPCFLTVAIETGHPLRDARGRLERRRSTCAGTGSTTRTATTTGGARHRPCGSRAAGRERRVPGAMRPPREGLVVERAGCDRSPIDAIGEVGRQKLRSFVWPDQVARLGLLDAAIEVARSAPADDRPGGSHALARREARGADPGSRDGGVPLDRHAVHEQGGAGRGRAGDRRRRQPCDRGRPRRLAAYGARTGSRVAPM